MTTPILRVDTSALDISGTSVPLSPGPDTPTGRARARSLSQSLLPSFRAAVSPNADSSSPTTETERPVESQAHSADRARNESRKLLAHLLSHLQNRPLPSSSLQTTQNTGILAEKGLGDVVQTVRVAVKHRRTRSEAKVLKAIPTDDSDSDLAIEDDAPFNTDATFDLVNQLKDVLIISAAQKWDILNDSTMPEARTSSTKPRDSVRYRRSVGQKSYRQSRSLSPSAVNSARPTQLLNKCIDVLASIVAEDCRFKTSSPRPSRPPCALQAVILDVAQFLVHSHHHDPDVLSQVAFAVIPAFHTFSPIMHPRLLAFFAEIVIGPGYNNFWLSQMNTNDRTPSSADTSFAASHLDEPPMVSILVEADDSSSALGTESGWSRWSKSRAGGHSGTRSTSAPGQDVTVYQQTSFIPALLAAVLEQVEYTNTARLPVVFRFHRLLDRIIEAKPDAYLDILSVIAYHTPKARYSGMAVLSSYWPRAFGHLAITKAYPLVSYTTGLARAAPGIADRRAQDHLHAHQFVPWRFNHRSRPVLYEGMSQGDCHACARAIVGFGLLCPFCMTSVHFDCYDYPDGSQFSQYSVISEGDKQRIAVYRFCHVLPHKRESPSAAITKGHTFRLVNIFSLTLCALCHRPLWGCVMQGLRCANCKQYVHSSCWEWAVSTLPRCRSTGTDDASVTIEWSLLRTSFRDFYQELIMSEEALLQRSYEEASLYHAILWLQLNILQYGVAFGSVVVAQDGQLTSPTSESPLHEFELHSIVALYETYLASNRLTVSDILLDHFQENGLQTSDLFVFFDWRVLAYIASVIKNLPIDHNLAAQATPNLLSVDRTGMPRADVVDQSASFEIFSLAHIRDQLGDYLQLFAEPAAKYALVYLSHLGFFQRLDGQQVTFDSLAESRDALCCCPLPLGLEDSPDVEILVSAVEASLSDLDLSVNEGGLLLLVRRFWPDGILTDYALRRLCAAVVSWVVSEDHNLAIVLRDYVARGRSLPGVRAGSEIPMWPSQARPAAMSFTNGGDYIVARRILLDRHTSAWLLALHDLNVDNYATMLSDLLLEIAEGGEFTDEYFIGKEGDERQMKRLHATADKILNMIVKLNQASVVFTAFDDLFKTWLGKARALGLDLQPLPSLGRLFNREVEVSQRFSSVAESRKSMSEASDLAASSALRVLVESATTNIEGFYHTIHCLCLCVRSGVDISVQTLKQLASLAQRFDAGIEDCSLLIKAVMWSTWLRSVGRQDLQSMVTAIHEHLAVRVVDGLHVKNDVDKIMLFIRWSLAIFLLLYGCDRKIILELGLIRQEEIAELPSRRKLHARSATMSDSVIINASFMRLLRRYVELDVDEVSCLIAKFLNAFVSDAQFVEANEIDDFILQNGGTLTACAWRFYDVQTPDISMIRPALFLRILVVDTYPFQELLDGAFALDSPWETRLQAALRLFRIILDVTNPAFHVEGRQWRTSVVHVFYRFFACLWADSREEIRTTSDTWAHTLLQAHLDAIALCWQETLATSPIAERVKLVSFLSQLQSHFPKWQLLTWGLITETLLESDTGTEDEAADHLAMYGLSFETPLEKPGCIDPDTNCLKVSLLSLSIRMMSSGISVDRISLLRIKDQLVRSLGFQDVAMVPTASGRNFHIHFRNVGSIHESALICLNDLMALLDSAQTYDVLPSMIGGPFPDDETTVPLLIGSPFVDVLLQLCVSAENVMDLPFTTSKNILKSLVIILYKHDFDSRPLRHLQATLRKAVRRALDMALTDINYELRQLALTTCQIFIKRWSTVAGNFPIEAIELVIKLMTSLNHEQNVDDVLVEQSTGFLVTVLSTFSSGGILNALFKRSMSSESFKALRHALAPAGKTSSTALMLSSLKDSLLRDTFNKSLDNDPDTFQTVMENVCTFVEVVHDTGYSSEMLQAAGVWLTGVARRAAEWPQGAINPSSMIMLACTLIQHHKAQSRDLLIYLETLLRATFTRCIVSAASLTRAVEVTSQLYRRAAVSASAGGDASSPNPILLALLEAISDGVYMRARVSGATLTSLLETMSAAIATGPRKAAILTDRQIQKLGQDMLTFLCHDSQSGRVNDALFTLDALQAAAHLLLDIAHYRSGAVRLWSATLRAWNIMVLAALQNRHKGSATLVLDLFPSFAIAYGNATCGFQRMTLLPTPGQQDPLQTDVSGAYASIKLWLLLVQRVTIQWQGSSESENISADSQGIASADVVLLLTSKMIWNELWPPFERVMSILEAETHVGNATPLASTVWASVADLLLFLRQSRSMVLDTSSEFLILDRLRGVMRGESKLMKVARSMSEPPPDVPFDYFVNQVVTELRAEEKLFAAHRQETLPERGRRIVS